MCGQLVLTIAEGEGIRAAHAPGVLVPAKDPLALEPCGVAQRRPRQTIAGELAWLPAAGWGLINSSVVEDGLW